MGVEKSPIEQLESGELPKMVHWYDPRLLARIGVRTVISAVFGQYADQRLVQSATDQVPVQDLCSRYDYSDPYATDPRRRLRMDKDGAFWIDYIADTGDGFETTYAMAYLLAKDSLNVPRAGELKAGDLLIMGGDQCYPQATRSEYKHRLETPFAWAYNVAVPERKLFAIPGNHDWYDGLQSFDSLFCAARDKLSVHNNNRIGAWQPQQHRSYWAIKLPYDWWIWGADIQFSKYLDASQENYFNAIADHMSPDAKLIICLAEPAWMIAEQQGQDEEQNLFQVTNIARSRGIRICAAIAGDTHHYNRYYTPELDVHFITAGGGGAFLHPTHVLKNAITVRWPEGPSIAADAGVPKIAAPRVGRSAEEFDIKLRNRKNADGVTGIVGDVLDPLERPRTRRTLRRRDTKCYPSKFRSLLLSFQNVFFPLSNFGFGVGIGVIYWLITWQYFSIATQNDISSGKLDLVSASTYFGLLARLPLYLMQGLLWSITFALMMAALFGTLVWYVEAVERPRWRRWLVKLTVGAAHTAAHVLAMFSLGLAFVAFHNAISPSVEAQVEDLWRTRGQRHAIVREVLQETIEPISKERMERREREFDRGDRRWRRQQRPMPLVTPEAAAPSGDTTQKVEYSQVRQLVGLLLYPVEMILIGGFTGGFIWGLYWVVTGLFGRMHAEDAFAALRIKDYKNFLRLKFAPDRLTIYPLGVDKVPRAAHWMAAPKNRPSAPNNPLLVPTAPIDVRLIEEPIVIMAGPTTAERSS